MEKYPLIEEDLVRDHLGKISACKPMGFDGMHPTELAKEAATPPSIIFER